MQVSTIRNSFIKQTIIVTVILAAFGGIVWYVSSFDEECDRSINQLKAQSDGIVRQVADLTSEYDKVTGYMAIYAEIKQKQDNKMLLVHKIALRDAIAGARSKYYIDDLDVKMGEIKALDAPQYKKETASIESSTVTVGLNALSDLDILGLIRVLSESFSGIKFTSLKITLAKNLDNTALITVKDTGFSPIVNGKITFTLFGLHSANSDEAELLNDTSGTPAQPVRGGTQKRIRLKQP